MNKIESQLLSLSPKLLSVLFVGFGLLYVAQAAFYVNRSAIYVADTSMFSAYKGGGMNAILLIIIVSLPYLLLWAIALGGYTRLREYTKKIHGSKDGKGFERLAIGVLLLTLWLPISALVGGLSRYYVLIHSTMISTMTYISNYLSVIILLTAFYIVYLGTSLLATTVKSRPKQLPATLNIAFIILVIAYSYAILKTPSSYHLSSWIIFFSLILPRAAAWYLGFTAGYQLFIYRARSKGVIYRKALAKMSLGLNWIVLDVVFVRLFNSFHRNSNFISLDAGIIISYLLLIALALGYVWIAMSSQQLQRLEEL